MNTDRHRFGNKKRVFDTGFAHWRHGFVSKGLAVGKIRVNPAKRVSKFLKLRKINEHNTETI